MSMINLAELTHLQDINRKLVSGYHISEQDLGLWQELDAQQQQYQLLFNQLGYNLVHDARGFFYIQVEDSTITMGKISRSFAVTLYSLVEYYANQGFDPLAALLEQDINLEVMQTLIQQNKALFEQLEIFSGSDLRKDVFGRMLRLASPVKTAVITGCWRPSIVTSMPYWI